MRKAVTSGGVTVVLEAAPSPFSVEEVAAHAVALAERVNDSSRRQTLRDIRSRIKAGTETAADRSRAIRVLIGLALDDKPEGGE